MIKQNKVVIIGCGNVGMSYAYALLNQRTKVTELVLIDIDKERVIGEVMDLNHCLAFSPSKIKIKVGDYKDCKDASIIVLSAGAKQKEGETRLDLLYKNDKIFAEIIKKVMISGFNGIFLVATNPVDIMTYLTYKHSNLKPSQVIGTGTALDTIRLRYLIGDKLNINPKNVHAYVMGEHGDSEFVSWSNAYVGTRLMTEILDISSLEEISNKVKNAAYEIIKKKGATYYAIGMVLLRITNAILDDENSILTVSTYNKKYDLFIGMPAVINSQGVESIIDIKLSESELKKFKQSIKIIKNEIKKLNVN
ncbi:MAG TPA: L-lactate dehydrogenase [Tenericutes bacterium]|nr:L-lactate dehydrogenase [Mycoplasmatota bacterium]